MKRIVLLIIAVSIWSSLTVVFGQSVYRWVDEQGIVHFTDDPTMVPEKFRGQVQQKGPSKEATPTLSPSPPPSPVPSSPPPPSPPPPPSSSPSPPPFPSPSPSPPDPFRPAEPSRMMEIQKGTPDGQDVRQKDMLGRGEEWWRATAKDWNQKFLTYRANYETAYNEWKAKEQELEESKFKPDSLKRKLKAEIKILEEKAQGLEKKMNEAKNMIETVLPQEARDYRANPEWLKIEQKK